MLAVRLTECSTCAYAQKALLSFYGKGALKERNMAFKEILSLQDRLNFYYFCQEVLVLCELLSLCGTLSKGVLSSCKA